MKNLLIILALFTTLTAIGQTPIKFKLAGTKVTTAIDGTTIGRGDQFDVIVQANGNGNTTTRQLMFDFQYDYVNFDIISVTHTGTGGNGGILPGGSTIQISHQPYPGYTAVNTNATAAASTNGNTILGQVSYSYNATSSNAILRSTLTWATASGMPYTSYDRLIVVRFKLKETSTATIFNPIKLNFVAGWNAQGVYDATYQETPLSIEPILDQNIGKFVTAKVDVNSNLLNVTGLKVSFRNTTTNSGQLFNILSDGKVDINQTSLSANTTYEVSIMTEMDKLYATYNNAITISDFTTAQNQFQTMGLDGSAGTVLQSGQSYYAADINRNKTIDAGDLPRLLAQVAGLDTLVMLPEQYTVGNNGWMSLPTWNTVSANTRGGEVEWAYVSIGTNSTTLFVDMREYPTGITPNMIKGFQLFDLYSGPVEFLSNDNTWAQYKIPSTLSKLGDNSSTFLPFIRSSSSTEYSFKAEFTFDPTVDASWDAITTTNWNTITVPKFKFTTGAANSNQILDLSYLVWGDVNRSHSSQVTKVTGNTVTLQTNAVTSLITNSAFRTMASNATNFINTSANITSIDVNLTNITVTSNSIEIPVNIDTKGASISGIQLQFEYDPTKIRFDEIKTELPDGWYIFANSKSGKVKFGAIDNQKKIPYNGNAVPFKLKFSTIGDGVNILTSVKVSPTMDASAVNGTQLGINLNTTQIKLTGYNNF